MVHILDLKHQGYKQTIAAFLVETSIGPVLIETGPFSAHKRLKKEIKRIGYHFDAIKHVFITHIHLDHAGGAWAFAERGATIYLHPIGLRHMAEPSKLMRSARRIYQNTMDTLWGQMEAIPMNQLRTVEHGETIIIGNQTFQAWHTPGHAIHHIAWQIGEHLIAGDVAGVKIGNGLTVVPCPPPDIHIEDWQDSINLIRNLNVKHLYLSHFNHITNVSEHLNEVETILLDWANWIKPHWESATPKEQVVPKFQAYVGQQLRDYGVSEKGIKRYEMANPSWMSVAGLMRYWRKKAEKAKQ